MTSKPITRMVSTAVPLEVYRALEEAAAENYRPLAAEVRLRLILSLEAEGRMRSSTTASRPQKPTR